jgi:hypothetical protein
MKLYEYALIYSGKKNKEGDFVTGKEPKLIAFEHVLAKDENQATVLASRAIPEEFVTELDRVTIAVRPF